MSAHRTGAWVEGKGILHMLDVIAAIDKGIGPGAALAGLGALGVLLALALGRGAVGLAAYARSRRGAGEQRRAEAVDAPVAEAVDDAPPAEPVILRRRAETPRRTLLRPEQMAMRVLDYLREHGCTGYMMSGDVDDIVTHLTARDHIETGPLATVRGALAAMRDEGIVYKRRRLRDEPELKVLARELGVQDQPDARAWVFYVPKAPRVPKATAQPVAAEAPPLARAAPRPGQALPRDVPRGKAGPKPGKKPASRKIKLTPQVATVIEGDLLVGYERAA